MRIRILPEYLINQICAGEVAERPASILKELIENALDAGATEIDIETQEGGKTELVISDNGSGMSKEDLEKSILRHATSKLPDENLFNICSFGFRGEALASIAAASRMTILTSNGKESWEMSVSAGKIEQVRPVTRHQGTTIKVSDLFFAIPARLNFLKTTRAEQGALSETIKRVVLGHPEIRFSWNKIVFKAEELITRAAKWVGEDFEKNCLAVQVEKNGYGLSGLIGTTAVFRHNSKEISVFVNGRYLKDSFIYALIRQAYHDIMAHDRYPVVVLFLKVPENEIDVNVHPAKTEVRFRNPQMVREIIIGGLRQELGKTHFENQGIPELKTAFSNENEVKEHRWAFEETAPAIAQNEKDEQQESSMTLSPFGAARFQLYKTYIVSESFEGWYLTDQHAAHERIVLETMQKKEIVRQALLIPDVFYTDSENVEVLIQEKENLKETGFVIEKMDETKIIIKEIPAFLKYISPVDLFKKITEEWGEKQSSNASEQIIHKIRSTIACHGSIRAGQSLSIPEMNALLNQIAQTPRAMQCNHGRPTILKLDRKILDKLFERA